MIRLKGYLRPYLAAILGAILLLFLQANADLALPDYMSRIVNVGIQQGGIDSPVPTVMRASSFDQLLLFTSGPDAELISEAYDRVAPGSDRAADVADRYPGTADQPVVELVELAGDEMEQLEAAIAVPLVIVGSFELIMTNPDAAPEMMERLGLQPPPGGSTDDISMTELPPEMRQGIVAQAAAQLEAMGPTALSQAATLQVRTEYEALGAEIGQIQTRYILSTGFWMLLLSLLSGVSTIIVGYISARVAAGLSRDLRLAVFEKVSSFSGAEMDKFSTASLITRSTNDIMQVQMVAVMVIRMVFYAPIIGIGGVIRAVGKSSEMWWVIAAAVGVLILLVLVIYKVAVPKFKIMQKLIDRLNLVSREGLAGMMVIRAFNTQQHEEDRFDKSNTELTDTTLFVNRVMAVMMPIMMLIMNGLALVIIWVGAQQIAASAMQVGDMMAFIQYAMQIVMAFLMLSMMFIMIPRAAVSADRIAEVLDTDASIRDPETPDQFGSEFSPTVEFKDVDFRYPEGEEDALCSVSFTANPGQTTAFIGATGSGKSTVVNLIPRFYDVTGGSIMIGGRDIRSVTQHDLRDVIGYVPQKASLFSGTIGSNLRYAREDAADEEVLQAAAVAQATEFVDDRTDGLDADISQGGANVSGGQKQRLSIGRALVKDPPIYIFDDSFSALDYRTDADLRKALRAQTQQKTVLIVSQRVSTIRHADQIVVLDDGKVVGKGTHDELMGTCKTYREIATSQLTQEELS